MWSSRLLNEKHTHDLTRVNLQFCETCQHFIVVSYHKNERGELVETGHELDIAIARSGVLKEEDHGGDQKTASKEELRGHERSMEEGCW